MTDSRRSSRQRPVPGGSDGVFTRLDRVVAFTLGMAFGIAVAIIIISIFQEAYIIVTLTALAALGVMWMYRSYTWGEVGTDA